MERLTVTLDEDLKAWGEEEGVNFSAILREGLEARKAAKMRLTWTPEKTKAFKEAVDAAVQSVGAALVEYRKPNGAAGEDAQPFPMDTPERRERAQELAEIKTGVLAHRFPGANISPDSLYREARLKLGL